MVKIGEHDRGHKSDDTDCLALLNQGSGVNVQVAHPCTRGSDRNTSRSGGEIENLGRENPSDRCPTEREEHVVDVYES